MTQTKEELRAYNRAWYHKQSKKWKNAKFATQKKYKQDNATKVNIYKAKQKCQTCGEDNPACLDLHHIGTKETEISNAVDNGWSWARIRKEIEQCIVLCSNCHRKLHSAR